MEAIDGPYAAALSHYVRDELEYRAGHMMYVHEPSRLGQSAQLGRFVTAGSPPQRSNRDD